MVESLCEKIRNLQGILEESHKNNIISNQARRVLESKIRGVAHDAEGWIESELHRLYMRFNNEFRENPGSILTNDDFPGPSSGASQRERRWIRTVTRKEEYPVNRTEEDPVNLPKREKNIKERPVKPSQSLYQALQQVKRRLESIERRSGKELPEPILKKSTHPKSPIEEEIVEETLEEDKGQEKEEPSPPLSSKATQAQDKGKEKVDLPMYQPPLPFPGRTGNDTYLKLLCDDNDNDLESFVFDENVLSSENDNDVHDTLHDVLDDDDVNDNDGLCELNDVETTTGKIKRTDEEQEKGKLGENPALDARPDARSVRVQWPQVENAEAALMDARIGRTRPRRVHQKPKAVQNGKNRTPGRTHASDVSAFPESKTRKSGRQ
nr:putative late blight resistance protein homolog R1C-3 isoform X3 [Ipomoea batatas]